jgi:selenocysteine lyase/cysteine desulfurase
MVGEVAATGSGRLGGSAFAAPDVAGYLDTATYGLPPRSTVRALEQALAAWRAREPWEQWEADGEACRALFALLIGARASDVAILPALSVAAGTVAISLPTHRGANVVLCEYDHHSTLFPWLALESRGVEIRLRRIDEMAAAVDENTVLAAVSAVQSADGAVADLEGLKATGVRLFVDGTHSVGAVELDLAGVDYLGASAYKWLLCPRGLCFLYVRPERLSEIEPWHAGWKSSERPSGAHYGPPRDLFSSARRLDVSLPWLVAAGARRSLETLTEVGVAAIAAHNLSLARRFCAESGLPPPESPIVRVGVRDADQALRRFRHAGIACSARAGAIRIGFHLYNTTDDAARASEALASIVAASGG